MVSIGCKAPYVQQSNQKMNVLFILVDDLGVVDLSVEGSTFYETPHIDKLANSGMRFTSGYANCSVCSPSRASILTGKAPPRHGVTDWIGAKTGLAWNRNDKILTPPNATHLPHDEITIAETLQAAGYKTFYSGKWHLGGMANVNKKDKGAPLTSMPTDHGFEINIGGYKSGSPSGGYFAPFKNPALGGVGEIPQGKHLSQMLAEETAKFIEVNQDKPFLAYLSFYAVHGSIQTSEQLWRKYQQKATQRGLADKRFKFDRTMAVRQVQDNPVYGGLIEQMDDAVGIVMDKLAALDLLDNTVVIFTSDNGGVSSGDSFSSAMLPYRGGKGRQWEGGIREPYYIVAPGVTKPKSVCDTPVTGTDFYPTILDLVGLDLKPEQHQDGVSLVPLLKGGDITKRNLYWHYPHYGNQGGEPSAIIRTGDYKLIHYYEDGRDELYHVKNDIGEQDDIIASHNDKAVKMRNALEDWLEDTGAVIPTLDNRFDADLKAKQLTNKRTVHLQKLERNEAKMLSADWQPNKTWWSSKVTSD